MITIVKLGPGKKKEKRTGVSNYCSVNCTIKLWNKLPAEALASFPCKSHVFRKRVMTLIITEEK